VVEQHRQLIAGLGLPVQGEFKLQDMLQAWMRDKKYRHGIRFVLLTSSASPRAESPPTRPCWQACSATSQAVGAKT
jgi:3-dehydroquinate synthetase